MFHSVPRVTRIKGGQSWTTKQPKSKSAITNTFASKQLANAILAALGNPEEAEAAMKGE
jgi:hypothetical protein